MKFLLVLSLLLTLTVQAKKKSNVIFGKSVTEKAARKLQKSRNARRTAVTTTAQTVPEKRRLNEVKESRRQLPYGTYEPTIEPTIVGTEPSGDDDNGKGYPGKGYYEGKGGKGDYEGKGYGNGGKGYGKGGKGGMMSGGMMSGGMMSGGKGGKGGKGGPKGDDEVPTDDCQLTKFEETFAMPGPTAFLAPDTTAGENGTPELPGTVFITELVNLLELDGETPILGSAVTGTCTRTTIGDEGGGVCQFVFIDDEGYSISVDGYLPGPLGGPLAITGGTGSLVGVYGQFDFFPIFSNNATAGDIFLDVIEYEVIADIAVVVCP